jgi:dephospho-CoA kinase
MGGGKSTVSAYLRRIGYPVLDADEIVRRVLRPGGKVESRIFQTFGEGAGIRGADGRLDRKALGAIVFADPVKLEVLENLIHPFVRGEVARQKAELESRGESAAFYDVPLLFEKKMESQFDFVWVVNAEASARLTRLVQRTGLSIGELEERFRRQLPPEIKEAKASAVLRNDGDLDSLYANVRETLKRLAIPSPTPAHT